MSEPVDADMEARLWQLGADTMRSVYDDRVPVMPEGMIPFNDVMLRSLVAQVWTRGELEMRDRRLLRRCERCR